MGAKSRKKLRISTPYGEFEMNADGRPDGSPSAFEKYNAELIEQQRAGDPDAFGLDEEAVRALGEEALLYRIRREFFFQNDDHVRARRDVLHGINIIEFIHTYAADPEQQLFYWQFRADQEIFLRLVQAQLLMEQKDYAGARREIETALRYVHDFYTEWGTEEAAEALTERREFLRKKFQEVGQAWENDPAPLANSTPTLQDQLDAAVRAEDYERAATLRDRIRARDDRL